MNKETLEEAAERLYPINSTGGDMEMLSRHQLNNCSKQEGFIDGAKWQSERMYSEEDLQEAFYAHNNSWIDYEEWFEQFKKK